MHTILILGGGEIGTSTAKLFSQLAKDDYIVHIADQRVLRDIPSSVQPHCVDATNKEELTTLCQLTKPDAIVSCLPYFCNKLIADVAVELNAHYFDLTEDVETSDYIKEVSKGSDKIFMPQCGLAPGFISLITKHLADQFDELHSIKMRVGALPVNPNNELKYNLTWSTNGLINECGNPCKAIENGEITYLQPLEGYERIVVDGTEYEAFNTSGGIGTLVDEYVGKVETMNYRTMRYLGHRDLFKFLMFDLKLNEDRDTFERILENAIPRTEKDVVIVYASVTGKIDNQLMEKHYVSKNYGLTLPNDEKLNAIQATTAGALCVMVDSVLQLAQVDKWETGFQQVENLPFELFISNRFNHSRHGDVYEVA